MLRAMDGEVPVEQAITAYASGWFPMDDDESAELPWYAPELRAVFELDRESLAALARRVRRSLRHGDAAGWELRADTAFANVLGACARPRGEDQGIWLTPRLARLYERLHEAGWAHSFELWAGEQLVAGALGVIVGRAVMLESMFHRVSDSGNAMLAGWLLRFAELGIELCDVQLLTDHTERLGAHEIPRDEYLARLRSALR